MGNVVERGKWQVGLGSYFGNWERRLRGGGFVEPWVQASISTKSVFVWSIRYYSTTSRHRKSHIWGSDPSTQKLDSKNSSTVSQTSVCQPTWPAFWHEWKIRNINQRSALNSWALFQTPSIRQTIHRSTWCKNEPKIVPRPARELSTLYELLARFFRTYAPMFQL